MFHKLSSLIKARYSEHAVKTVEYNVMVLWRQRGKKSDIM